MKATITKPLPREVSRGVYCVTEDIFPILRGVNKIVIRKDVTLGEMEIKPKLEAKESYTKPAPIPLDKRWVSAKLSDLEKKVKRLSSDRINKDLLKKIIDELSNVDELIHQLGEKSLEKREFSIVRQLMEIIPPEIIELEEGEIKRLDERNFVEKRNGIITIYYIEIREKPRYVT